MWIHSKSDPKITSEMMISKGEIRLGSEKAQNFPPAAGQQGVIDKNLFDIKTVRSKNAARQGGENFGGLIMWIRSKP